jgi:hypothetical protein
MVATQVEELSSDMLNSFRSAIHNVRIQGCSVGLTRRYQKVPEASDIKEYQYLPLSPTRCREASGKQ